MRNAVKHVDRKRFRDPNDDESKNSSSDDDGEEGEDEGEEMGEDELSSSMNSEKAQKNYEDDERSQNGRAYETSIN